MFLLLILLALSALVIALAICVSLDGYGSRGDGFDGRGCSEQPFDRFCRIHRQ